MLSNYVSYNKFSQYDIALSKPFIAFCRYRFKSKKKIVLLLLGFWNKCEKGKMKFFFHFDSIIEGNIKSGVPNSIRKKIMNFIVNMNQNSFLSFKYKIKNKISIFFCVYMTTIFPITPTIKKISVGHSNVSILYYWYWNLYWKFAEKFNCFIIKREWWMVKLHRRVSVIYYVGYFDKNFIALLTIFDLFAKLLKKNRVTNRIGNCCFGDSGGIQPQ